MDNSLATFVHQLLDLEIKFRNLEDRVSVMEERTCDHESRLEDLERWQEKAQDQLDEY